MTFPARRRDWKRVRPTNIRESFRLCKEFARERKNLSVARIAELMGISEDLLYKWLSNGKMPANLIPTYEHICGCHFATEYLAGGAARLVIEIPTGRNADPMEMGQLQLQLTETVALLMRYYKGEANQQQTLDSITNALIGLATHRENVARGEQVELDLAGG